MTIGGYEISRAHALQLAQIPAQDAREDEYRLARTEEWQYQCATMAPAVHEQLELARAKVDADAHRAAVAEQRAREQRLADFEE